MKKVLVFGVFDSLHNGHRDFLQQAKKCGDFLVAVAAQDKIILELKSKLPRQNLRLRMSELKKTGLVDRVVAGDKKIGDWKILKKEKPDIIAFGYDQKDLRDALKLFLKRKKFLSSHQIWRGDLLKIETMKSYQPKKYHSSLIRPRA